MKSILDRLRNEPVLVSTLLATGLVLLAQAGVPISDGLANAISAFVIAAFAIFARSQVSPASSDD